MSERLDRIEALLEGHGMAIADLRARQEVMQIQQERMQQQQEVMQQQQERTSNQIENLVAQGVALNDKLDRLANIVLRVHNRQDDHEDRINRLEQE